MLQQTLIEEVIKSQKERLCFQDAGLHRDLLKDLPDLQSHALIISGIRRCGKSTLMHQMFKKYSKDIVYLNFEDMRLFGFLPSDFQLLDSIIDNLKKKILFFDEIQIVQGWELYIRQKLDQGFKVVITGSNASLLSKELGTKLTGRQITKELYPFSYKEFLSFKKLKAGEPSLKQYLKLGGFPQYLQTENEDVLSFLFSDILERDIIVRRGIRDIASLKNLALYLASNVGSLVSATKLQQMLGIKTPTILDYFSFLEDTYLAGFMPKFSYSSKAQSINPKKIYIIDNALIKSVSTSFSDNFGSMLENLVYWQLRRQGKEIFYFNENNCECDFVVIKNNSVEQVIQVCYELNPQNLDREKNGLSAAMDFLKTDNGIIITYNQTDTYMKDDKKIKIMPFWKLQAL